MTDADILADLICARIRLEIAANEKLFNRANETVRVSIEIDGKHTVKFGFKAD
jgi:hypothetical protein